MIRNAFSLSSYNIPLETAEFKKGCMLKDGTNNYGINITGKQVDEILNTSCLEEEDGNLVTCVCDDQDFCNNANNHGIRVRVIVLLAMINIAMFI